MDVQLHHMDRVEVALPTYSYVFNFEKNFVYSDTQAWMRDHFPNCFYYCAIYILLIFGGRYYMSNRPKFEIRGMLILWNIILALLFIVCNFRVMPEYHVLSHHAYYHSVCIPRKFQIYISFYKIVILTFNVIYFHVCHLKEKKSLTNKFQLFLYDINY